MRTINIPTSKLIKYIPSEPDGGVIPGKVLECFLPSLEHPNDHEFKLHYFANSESDGHFCFCKLDEELEFVEDSNRLWPRYAEPTVARLSSDGVTFKFGAVNQARWEVDVCVIPSPYVHCSKLSSFVKYGLNHVACCETGSGIHLAVITKEANKISDRPVITSQIGPDKFESLTFGPPCQHNVGWLIPWASKSKGINIAWLEDVEMDRFVSQALPLPKS